MSFQGLENSVMMEAAERELMVLQMAIDESAFRLYGVDPKHLLTLDASTKSAISSDVEAGVGGHDDDDDADDEGIEDGDARGGDGDIISWLVGVAFDRFDPRLATGERAIPPEPEPFDPLPSRSPGMWPVGEEPAQRKDVLVDDKGHPDDLAARVHAMANTVHVDVLENLRAWLAKDFFSLHIKMYSKSRRKAPIYWQLATPSASYSVWLYIHAFSKDTLFRVQNEYVAAKLSFEERRLRSLAS